MGKLILRLHHVELRTSLAILLAIASFQAISRDRPGTPNEPRAEPSDPTSISIGWHNTARSDELVKYEVEFTRNGTPVSGQQPENNSGKDSGWSANSGYIVRNLEPESRYCFRVWSRYVDNQVQSERPSAWACTNTPAIPPLAPLDVKVILTLDKKQAVVSWNTADQSNHRPVASFEIERQSPPGPNRPTLREANVAGPAGAQAVGTKLAFSVRSSALDPVLAHQFRVCAVNSGGRTCAAPVIASGTTVNPGLDRRDEVNGLTVPPSSRSSAFNQNKMAQEQNKTFSAPPAPAPAAMSNWQPKSAGRFNASGACKPGYVWREAQAGDHVCVTPGARARIAEETRLAYQHTDSRNTSGPASCKSGFVWREAFNGDTVCVTPGGRNLAREENSHASEHRQ